MRLKRLDCIGFKSFADRTTFKFEPGITALIGPNGSGKSNVVDAIKWVLGETRPKSLRGGEMQDVVFKGAEGRSGSGFAEVSLVLDNEDCFLPGRGSEVSIGRRLFKTGESEYLIDRQVMRRKDVRELLLDTGLGVGAYSVMEQGKIDAVLSANPEDRRQIFEEASGISRFKLRRKEALRKLDRTEQNLLRVTDLLEEKQSRLRSLKIQAGRARRYKELQVKLVSLRVALGIDEINAAGQQQREATSEIKEREERLAKIEDALLEASQSLDGFRTEEGHLEEELETLAATLTEVRSREQGSRERMRSLEQQINGAEKRIKEAGGQRDRILASRTQQEQEFFAAQEDAKQRAGELEDLRGRLSGAREVHADWAVQLRQSVEERRLAEEESLEWLHEISRAGNRVSDIDGRVRSLIETGKRLTGRATQLDDSLRELAEGIRRLQEEEAWHEQDGAAAMELVTSARATRDDAVARLLVLNETAQGLREELSGLKSRMEILRDLELTLAGMDEGPRRVLEAEHEGVLGRLVDQLDCGPQDARALEAALGDRVNALVVEDADAAGRILTWLRDNHLGYVHLVLARAREKEHSIYRPLPQVSGVIDWLQRRVTARTGFSASVETLLGQVLLVADLQSGRLASQELGRGFICVTPQGERIEDGILVSGGFIEVGAGPIQRRTELKELTESVRQSQVELEENQALIARTREEEQQASQTEAEAQVACKKAEQAAQRVGADLLRAEERAAGQSRERETLRLELEQATTEQVDVTSELEAANAAHEAAKESGQESDQRLFQAREMVESITNHREEALKKENQLRVDIATAESDLEGLDGRISVLGRNVQENGVRVEELRHEVEVSQADIIEARRELGDLEEKTGAFLEDRAEIEQRIKTLQDNRGNMRTQARNLDVQVEAGRDEREELRSKIERLNFRVREVTHDLAATREKLLEEHDVDLEFFQADQRPFGPPLPPGCNGEGLSIFGPGLPGEWAYPEESVIRIWEQEEYDPAGARGEIANVRRGMDRIGTVNLRAVEELAAEEGAVGLLAREEEDLRHGRQALMEMIDHINVESARLFNETFDQARVNFMDIFRKLFQGGKADILLTAGDDPLEAGIEIVARPPGKQLQNINLLSGGERTLCALAILFSVFKVKPSPFAVLDEVDAALDDSNVDRFLEVLKDFVARTQFLVVTHNKRTMAFAEVLYGITMQRKGVSTCVSVRLDEAEQIGATAS